MPRHRSQHHCRIWPPRGAAAMQEDFGGVGGLTKLLSSQSWASRCSGQHPVGTRAGTGTGGDAAGARGRAGEGEKPRLHSNRYLPRNGVLSASLIRVAINNSIFSFTHMNAAGRGSGRAQPPSVWGGKGEAGLDNRLQRLFNRGECGQMARGWRGGDGEEERDARGSVVSPEQPGLALSPVLIPVLPWGGEQGTCAGDKPWHIHISLSAGDMDVGAGGAG